MFLCITCRKALLTSVHFFVHLNLAISLFLAYLVFVLGIELARSSTVCTVRTVGVKKKSPLLIATQENRNSDRNVEAREPKITGSQLAIFRPFL